MGFRSGKAFLQDRQDISLIVMEEAGFKDRFGKHTDEDLARLIDLLVNSPDELNKKIHLAVKSSGYEEDVLHHFEGHKASLYNIIQWAFPELAGQNLLSNYMQRYMKYDAQFHDTSMERVRTILAEEMWPHEAHMADYIDYDHPPRLEAQNPIRMQYRGPKLLMPKNSRVEIKIGGRKRLHTPKYNTIRKVSDFLRLHGPAQQKPSLIRWLHSKLKPYELAREFIMAYRHHIPSSEDYSAAEDSVTVAQTKYPGLTMSIIKHVDRPLYGRLLLEAPLDAITTERKVEDPIGDYFRWHFGNRMVDIKRIDPQLQGRLSAIGFSKVATYIANN